jgi:hypothetical protein
MRMDGMNIAAARFTPHGMTISFMNRTADPLTKTRFGTRR